LWQPKVKGMLEVQRFEPNVFKICQKFLTQVGSDQPAESENFPLKNPNFSIFPSWHQKNIIGSGKKYLGQRQVGPLFTEDRKYACYRSL